MEDLLKKVSQYQLFNFLLVGAIFMTFLTHTTSLKLDQENVVATVFTYYFVGLVISRIGSLIIEPLFKRLRIVTYEPYSEYLVAVEKDPKIDILSQENNMYRTLATAFLVFLVIYVSKENWSHVFEGKHKSIIYILGAALSLLFVFAYRKQTSYISHRIKKASGK